MRCGIQPRYAFKTQDYSSSWYDTFKKGRFCLSLVTSYGNPDINIVNCIFRFDGKSYIVSA